MIDSRSRMAVPPRSPVVRPSTATVQPRRVLAVSAVAPPAASAAAPLPPPLPATTRSPSEMLFDALDSDGDGVISRGEFARALGNLGGPLEPATYPEADQGGTLEVIASGEELATVNRTTTTTDSPTFMARRRKTQAAAGKQLARYQLLVQRIMTGCATDAENIEAEQLAEELEPEVAH